MMVPQVLSIVHATFPAHERGKVFGLFGAPRAGEGRRGRPEPRRRLPRHAVVGVGEFGPRGLIPPGINGRSRPSQRITEAGPKSPGAAHDTEAGSGG
ncbi:MFS transporter, partial [Streptomyces sp. NPDC006465]